MTYRLVGVISIVLLLCLATFAFATKHYQDEVMDELANTVSVVGKAAFRSLEEPPHGAFGQMVYTVRDESPLVEKEKTGGDPDSGRRIHIFRHGTADCPPGDLPLEKIVRDGSDPLDRFPQLHGILEEKIDGGEGNRTLEIRIVQTDAIRVEGDPREMLMLHIPVHDAAGEEEIRKNVFEQEEVDTSYQVEWIPEDRTAPAAASIAGVETEDIILPIPTGDFGAMFDSFRAKSIVLFCGVFLVGIVLSTGLASRFTRPIRRLDSGIKRLSDGDLDVQVLVRGNDEVARLGLAFNEMTRRLRLGRDRAREMTRREKLSALGRLAAGVAHDVRNPLHSIGLTLRHLQETGRPEADGRAEEFDRSVGIIREEVRRLDRLVENFLRFARSDRSERSPVDLADLLEETGRLVRKEAEWRGVEVRIDCEEGVPPLLADVEAIRSSLLNLVLNSFEAMPEGGELILKLLRDGGETVLEVADTGVGIPEDDRERVFDFSYSTREGGNGLGLAMVHQYVVEDHGGRVHLESREGKGTRIRLSFPGDEGEVR